VAQASSQPVNLIFVVVDGVVVLFLQGPAGSLKQPKGQIGWGCLGGSPYA